MPLKEKIKKKLKMKPASKLRHFTVSYRVRRHRQGDQGGNSGITNTSVGLDDVYDERLIVSDT